MPEPPPSAKLELPGAPWWGTAIVAVIGIAAAVGYSGSREVHAAGGSPLYDTAVREALRGLADAGGGGAAAVAGERPPLPAGLSPADHYWCEKCKTYHRRQPDQSLPSAPALAPPAGAAALAPAGGIPPLPAGLAPADYYWCEKCKAYHKREPQPAGGQAAADPAAHGAAAPAAPASVPAAPQGGAATPPAAAVPVSPLPAAVPGQRPPLPAGLSPADYEWCEQCKTYHPRKQPGATPVSPVAPAAPAVPAAPAAGSKP
jgi:hypothetical protein